MTYLLFAKKPTSMSLLGSFEIESDSYGHFYARGCEKDRELAKHYGAGGYIAVECDERNANFRVEFDDQITDEHIVKFLKISHPMWQ